MEISLFKSTYFKINTFEKHINPRNFLLFNKEVFIRLMVRREYIHALSAALKSAVVVSAALLSFSRALNTRK